MRRFKDPFHPPTHMPVPRPTGALVADQAVLLGVDAGRLWAVWAVADDVARQDDLHRRLVGPIRKKQSASVRGGCAHAPQSDTHSVSLSIHANCEAKVNQAVSNENFTYRALSANLKVLLRWAAPARKARRQLSIAQCLPLLFSVALPPSRTRALQGAALRKPRQTVASQARGQESRLLRIFSSGARSLSAKRPCKRRRTLRKDHRLSGRSRIELTHSQRVPSLLRSYKARVNSLKLQREASSFLVVRTSLLSPPSPTRVPALGVSEQHAARALPYVSPHV